MHAETAVSQEVGELTSQLWKVRLGEGRVVRMERGWMSTQKTWALEERKSLMVARPRQDVPPVMKTTLSLRGWFDMLGEGEGWWLKSWKRGKVSSEEEDGQSMLKLMPVYIRSGPHVDLIAGIPLCTKKDDC